MNITTHKAKKITKRISRFLFCFLTAAFVLAPSVALAASQVYGIACATSDVKVSKHSADCSAAADTLRLYEIGNKSPRKPYPTGYGITVVTVDCGKSSPTTPLLNGPVKFACKKSSIKPTLKGATIIQHAAAVSGSGSLGGQVTCDPTTDATCPVCQSSNPPAGCVDCGSGTCSDPAANPNTPCDTNGCDLIGKYIDPFINLFSVTFGFIAVASIIMGGIQYASSTGDPQKVTAAKQRITNTLIALVAYFFLYGFLQFLIPGGAFNG
ncbi:MAG TPA: pilin [Candidatus Dormibacteraeota bacterium]|nr:pilin [Candidatus Dormibacteraeota bacterium]